MLEAVCVLDWEQERLKESKREIMGAKDSFGKRRKVCLGE